jgi:hypothetical protein
MCRNLQISGWSRQFFLAESAFLQEFPEDVREVRIPIVVLVVDLFTAFSQVMLQVP